MTESLVDVLKKRLNMIKENKSLHKEEKVSYNGERCSFSQKIDPKKSIDQRNTRAPRLLVDENLRKQFLNKSMTSEEVLRNLGRTVQNDIHHENSQIESIYNRAQQVNSRLKDPQPSHLYYARAPANSSNDSIPVFSQHSSPLIQSNSNGIFHFQATPENAKEVMIDSNPYADIPYRTQNIAKQIGADLDTIRKKVYDRNVKKRKLPQEPNTSSVTAAGSGEEPGISTSVVPQEVIHVPRKEVSHKTTQTTINTGDLRFEICSNDLQNLSEAKKQLLLDFMDAFGIHDCRKVSSVKERLQHRTANQGSNKRTAANSSTYLSGPHI